MNKGTNKYPDRRKWMDENASKQMGECMNGQIK